jgi:ribosomal protein S5
MWLRHRAHGARAQVSGIVAARVPKKVLQFAGIEDMFTSSSGSTKTLGNFVKVWQIFPIA